MVPHQADTSGADMTQQQQTRGYAPAVSSTAEVRGSQITWGVSHAAVDALRMSVWWMCPRSRSSCIAVCTGMKLEPAEEIAYWKHLISVESGIPIKRLECSPNTPKRWKRLFLDFERSAQRLLTTDKDYERLFPLNPLRPRRTVPKALQFNEAGTTVIDTGSPDHPPDKCVIGNAFVPSVTSATVGSVDPETGKYRIDYRREYYFEVRCKVRERGDGNWRPRRGPPCFSIGFGSARIEAHKFNAIQAGWKPNSWGLHSDDGNVYAGEGQSTQHVCNSFGVGSVVGAGVITSETDTTHRNARSVFFTLNGTLLGIASEVELPIEAALLPICGVDCNWELEFNFGQEPFVFDVATLYADQSGSLPAVQEVERLRQFAYMNIVDLLRTVGEDQNMDEAQNASPRNAEEKDTTLEQGELGDGEVQKLEEENAVPYGPVWPWHQPKEIRPLGLFYNARTYLGSWATGASDRYRQSYGQVRIPVLFDGHFWDDDVGEGMLMGMEDDMMIDIDDGMNEDGQDFDLLHFLRNREENEDGEESVDDEDYEYEDYDDELDAVLNLHGDTTDSDESGEEYGFGEEHVEDSSQSDGELQTEGQYDNDEAVGNDFFAMADTDADSVDSEPPPLVDIVMSDSDWDVPFEDIGGDSVEEFLEYGSPISPEDDSGDDFFVDVLSE